MVSRRKKAEKDQTRRAIDSTINEIIFPGSQTETPGRSSRHAINNSRATYDASLQKESTPSTINFFNPS